MELHTLLKEAAQTLREYAEGLQSAESDAVKTAAAPVLYVDLAELEELAHA